LEDGTGEVKALLHQTLSTTRSGLNETRRALQALRAGPLDDLGLALAIRSLAESVASRGSLKLSLDIQDPLENLAPELEQGIYRVAQEALENVTRHARASDLQVHLSQSRDCLELIISDNGRGFDLRNINQSDQFGIRGMRERTEMLGGQLEMESQPERGTTIKFSWKGSL
jgi:signal transduction histidine kinase